MDIRFHNEEIQRHNDLSRFMHRKIKIIVLFLFLIFSPGSKAKTKWEKLPSPENIKLIVGGKSLHDFWLTNNENNLLHFTENKWTIYPFHQLYSAGPIRSFVPILTGNDRLFVLITKKSWKTHIVEIKNGEIIHYHYVSESPLYSIVNVSGKLYATGNFGIILQLIHGHWEKINSPIHTHISAVIADNNGILWIGTSGEGVFAYNGKTFTRFKLPGIAEKTTVAEMQFIHDTLYINTSKGKIFKKTSYRLYPVSSGKIAFRGSTQFLATGYYRIVSAPNKIRYIPYLFKIKSFKELNDGHALVITQDEKLFYDRAVKNNFFLNFAPILGVKGPEYTYSSNSILGNSISSLYRKLRPGILIADFNRDNYQDILLFNISNQRHPFLYLNNKEHYFNNFANLLELNKFTFNGFFSFAFDLNGDNIPEIISSDFRNNHYYVNILEKTTGKYQLLNSLPMPQKYSVKPLQYMSFTDIDNDGDLDMALVFGYSSSGSGNILFLKNNGYGKFSQPDTTLSTTFKGWNVQTLFADFNNDGLNDIFVTRNWSQNVLYLRTKSNTWKRKMVKTPQNFVSQQRKGNSMAFDFDNDGDLDIVTLAEQPFIRLLQNDGKGNFTDITQSSGLQILNHGNVSGSFNAGDFDNNGFIDLFVTVHSGKKWKNTIFMNDSGKFVNRSKEMGIAGGNLEFAAIGDLDNDGDLDIYGFRKGNDILWLNNLDRANYLQFQLRGIKSNSTALGARIWLYEAGHLNERNYLTGYRQTGSMMTGLNFQNENRVHFGVNSHKKYDVRIVFPSGETKIMRNLSPGKTIQIAEISPPLSWIYQVDNMAHILLRNKTFLSYLAVVVLGILFLMLTILYGTKTFRWDVRLTTIIVSLNLIIFGILLVSLYTSTSLLKYYLPLSVIFTGSLGPVGFFLWIKTFTNLKSQKEKSYELFQSLQNFSHGAWASSNLNSLQLFFENLSLEDLSDPVYRTPFEKRKQIFMDLTLPVLNQIISLSKELVSNNDITLDMERYNNFLITALTSDYTQIDFAQKEKMATAIMKLRELLSKLKNKIFSEHSCHPAKIINDIKIELNPLMAKEKVNLKRFQRLPENYPALMDAIILADILDNCIQNAVKAMADTEDKQLTIKLLKGDPHIFIEITDNGAGIPDDKHEEIFKNGYTTTGSTGYGLFYARETLSKYGGRIFVKNSIPYQRTTFVIELQKGSNP